MKPALSTANVCALAAALLLACEPGSVTGPDGIIGPPVERPDAGDPPVGGVDAGEPPDASEPLPGEPDASTGGAPDAGGHPDASAGPPDASAGTPDARPADAGGGPGPADAGTPDARVPDAALPPPTGPDCTNAASWPADWVALEDQVLVLVNQRRAAGATCGGVSKPAVPPLRMDAALRQAARCHSLDMAQHNYFSHDSQDGRSPWDRINNAGYTGFGNAENIAAGQSSAASVMDSWMTSTGHCNNIMTSGSNEIGIGLARDDTSDFDRYWTQDFGKR